MAERMAKEAREGGVGVKSTNKRQMLFIMLDEPESSAIARIISLLIMAGAFARVRLPHSCSADVRRRWAR